jgi:hypothetical protein
VRWKDVELGDARSFDQAMDKIQAHIKRRNDKIESGEVNRLSGEQITIDKRWPGELYGDFKKGEKIGETSGRKLKWEEKDIDEMDWFNLEQGDRIWLLDEDIDGQVTIQYNAKKNKYELFDDDEYVDRHDSLESAKAAAVDYLKGYFPEDFKNIGGAPVFENQGFNTSATIPSKMKKYGGEEVGKANLDDSVPTPSTPITAKTPASFPLYDVTGIAQMLKDQVKKEGGGKAVVAKVALKYGVPAALLTKWLLADEDEKREMLKNNPALRRLGT